ncbi:MAG: ATP-binding response regulator [Thermoplasmatota archaeon]
MKFRVLVVEDSTSDLDLVLESLRRTPGAPLEIEAVKTLKEAVQRCEKGSFDVALVDLNLPDSQGIATIRALAGAHFPPVVAHTGDIDEGQGLQAIEAGAEDFVVKGSVAGVRLRRILQFAFQRRQARGSEGASRRLESIVAERTNALEEANALLHLATDGLSEVLFLAEAEPLRIIYVNKAYRTVFGRDPDLMMQDPLDWMKAIHPDDQPLLTRLAKGPAAAMPPHLRYRIIHTSGAVRWIDVRTKVSAEGSGQRAYYAGLIQDVTAEVDAEAAELAAREQARRLEVMTQANAFKASFLNLASHELGTPLTTLRLQLAYMKILITKSGDALLTSALAVVERNIVRLAGLVQDLLVVGQSQSKTMKLDWRPVDLSKLGQEAVETMAPVAKKGSVGLKIDDPGHVVFTGDERRISEIVMNLLSNAIKYTPPAGAVRVRLVRSERQVVLEVTDTGRGIAADDVSQLFHPFVRLGDVAAVAGTGLGLYICKILVEAHGGTIECRSEGLGRGSTFTVRLPLAPPGSAPAAA